jgi:hypothetical protein
MDGWFTGERNWRKALDWPTVLAGVMVDDERSNVRLASYLRGGVRRYLIRETSATAVEDSVERCLHTLLDRVRSGTVQHVDTLPQVLLQIVRAEAQTFMDQAVERLLEDDDQVPESSTS